LDFAEPVIGRRASRRPVGAIRATDYSSRRGQPESKVMPNVAAARRRAMSSGIGGPAVSSGRRASPPGGTGLNRLRGRQFFGPPAAPENILKK
jgi:hypothetical protein